VVYDNENELQYTDIKMEQKFSSKKNDLVKIAGNQFYDALECKNNLYTPYYLLKNYN